MKIWTSVFNAAKDGCITKQYTTRRSLLFPRHCYNGGFEVPATSSNFPKLQSVEDMTECNQMRSKQIVCFLQPGFSIKNWSTVKRISRFPEFFCSANGFVGKYWFRILEIPKKSKAFGLKICPTIKSPLINSYTFYQGSALFLPVPRKMLGD